MDKSVHIRFYLFPNDAFSHKRNRIFVKCLRNKKVIGTHKFMFKITNITFRQKTLFYWFVLSLHQLLLQITTLDLAKHKKIVDACEHWSQTDNSLFYNKVDYCSIVASLWWQQHTCEARVNECVKHVATSSATVNSLKCSSFVISRWSVENGFRPSKRSLPKVKLSNAAVAIIGPTATRQKLPFWCLHFAGLLANCKISCETTEQNVRRLLLTLFMLICITKQEISVTFEIPKIYDFVDIEIYHIHGVVAPFWDSYT